MTTICMKPVPGNKFDIITWLQDNISDRISVNDGTGFAGQGWRFYWFDNTYQYWAVDIEDNVKAVEFKLRFL